MNGIFHFKGSAITPILVLLFLTTPSIISAISTQPPRAVLDTKRNKLEYGKSYRILPLEKFEGVGGISVYSSNNDCPFNVSLGKTARPVQIIPYLPDDHPSLVGLPDNVNFDDLVADKKDDSVINERVGFNILFDGDSLGENCRGPEPTKWRVRNPWPIGSLSYVKIVKDSTNEKQLGSKFQLKLAPRKRNVYVIQHCYELIVKGFVCTDVKYYEQKIDNKSVKVLVIDGGKTLKVKFEKAS